jgi:hypothetical protein
MRQNYVDFLETSTWYLVRKTIVLHRKPIKRRFSNEQIRADMSIPNWQLIGFRIAWGILVLFNLGLFIVSIPAYFSSLQTPCTGTNIHCFASFQLTPGNIQALQSIHLSLNAYAVYMLILDIIVSFAFMITGAVICWRLWGKAEERLGLFISLLLITLGSFGTLNTQEAALENMLLASPLQIILRLAAILLWIGVGIFFYSFPSGHFVPRWTRYLIILWIMQAIFFSLPVNSPLAISNWPPLFYLASLLLTFGSAAFLMIYRYIRVFDSSQRQQTKWLIFGFAAILPLNPLYAAIGYITGVFNIPASPYQLLEPAILSLIVIVVPLCISFAILRYRLWDIDLLINRVLVYGLLTGMLALIYVVGILSMQILFHDVIGGNQLALVGSTLVSVALFHPLRSRIQRIIDRRFYRSKYDAALILANFSATLRNEIDLTQLSDHLVTVVKEAMQPSSISLWLRKPEQHISSSDHKPLE